MIEEVIYSTTFAAENGIGFGLTVGFTSDKEIHNGKGTSAIA